MARRQLAEDVLHHDDRAVDDHAEVDRADRQQVGRNVRPVEADEREQQRERNRHRDDERRADAEQKQPRMTSTSSMPRSRLRSTVFVVS